MELSLIKNYFLKQLKIENLKLADKPIIEQLDTEMDKKLG